VSSDPVPGNGKSGARSTPPANLAAAIARLDASLARLETAFEARMERDAGLLDAEAEVQRMGADRTRLAEALDSVEARAKRLDSTNREVSRRLVDAMEAIRTVLDRHPDANG
jgi:predicted  nucleic acid-binding Zn-ribbon protein